MDPISLVVAALVAGAAAGTRDTAGAAIADAYAALKALLRRRFGAADELEQIERGGDTTALQRRLEAAGVDEELVSQAAELLRHLDPDGARAGKYQVKIIGGQGTVVGDNATVTMNFGA